MNKEWVEQKNQEYADKINHIMTYIEPAIENNPMLDEERKKKILNHLHNEKYSLAGVVVSFAYYFVEDDQEGYDVFKKWCMDVSSQLEKLESYKYNKDAYSRYLDSEPMEFDGDIIITDPCYIIKHRDESTRPKWEDYMRLPSYQGMSKKEMESAGYFEDYEKFQEAKDKWDKENPDDWDAFSVTEENNIFYFKTGRGLFFNDYEISDCYDEEYEDIGITKEEITAEFLATVNHIDEFFVCIDDSDVELGCCGDNAQDGQHKINLIEVEFEDVATGAEYPVSKEVIDKYNKGGE